MGKRRVVVTGMGIVSPVGSTVESAWSNILAGRSGIGPVTAFDVASFPVRIGGAVKDFQIEQYLPIKEARKMDAFIHYGIGAAVQAIRDSGLEVTEANAERIGLPTIEETERQVRDILLDPERGWPVELRTALRARLNLPPEVTPPAGTNAPPPAAASAK